MLKALFFSLILTVFQAPFLFAGKGSSVLPGLVQNIQSAQILICQAALKSERISQTSNLLAYQITRTSLSQVSLPEDRLLIELSSSSHDPILAEISSQGQKEISRTLQRQMTNVKVASALIGVSPLTERQAVQILASESDLNIKKMMLARDKNNWNEAIRIYEEEFSEELKELEFSQQQYAFCLNRRGTAQDKVRAIEILTRLIEEGSDDGEVYGLLGRIYKDAYYASKEDEEVRSEHSLELLTKAIDTYQKGFMADPTNYYPGVNVLHLLVERNLPGDIQEARQLSTTLRFMIKRLGSEVDEDFWVQSTLLTLNSFEGHWPEARKVFEKIIAMRHTAGWMYETTATSLKVYEEFYGAQLEQNSTPENFENFWAIHGIITALKGKITTVAVHTPRVTMVTSGGSESLLGAGVLNTAKVDLHKEASAIGFGATYDMLEKHAKAVITPQEYLKNFRENDSGYLLGLTKAAHRTIYSSYAKAGGLETWWKSYERLGISGDNPDHTRIFMERITSEGTPVVFLVPRGLFHSTTDMSFTAKEMEWILAATELRAKNVTFVLGAYEMIPERFVEELQRRRGNDTAGSVLDAIIHGYQNFLFTRP